MHAPPRQQSRPPKTGSRRAPARRTRWGTLPARSGVWAISLSAALGLIVTVVAGREPGDLLGVFLIAGTLVAGLAVRTEAVHLMIPVPPLAFLPASLIAGLIHDRATDGSTSALAVSALQWMAGGFLTMTAATLLALALTIGRRLRTRGPAPRAPWAPQIPQAPRAPRASSAPRVPRAPRQGRDDHDRGHWDFE